MNSLPRIVAISISERKGEKKKNVSFASLKENFGILGDAHAGSKNRQVSLLALESIQKISSKGLNVKPGDFAENITTEGIALWKLKLGAKLKIGKEVLLEVSQIGKDCQNPCAIYYQVGDCVMPREGIFCRVIKGGSVRPGDQIELLDECSQE